MQRIYYRHDDGRIVGPLTPKNIQENKEEGRIEDSTLIRIGKRGGWQPYKSFAAPIADWSSGTRYYYRTDKAGVIGPISWADLSQLHASRTLNDETLVASEDRAEWIPYGALDEERAHRAAELSRASASSTERRYSFVDDEGALRGPFPLRTLAALRSHGKLRDDAAVIAEDGNCITRLDQIIVENRDNSVITAAERHPPSFAMEPGLQEVGTAHLKSSTRPSTVRNLFLSWIWLGAIGLGIYAVTAGRALLTHNSQGVGASVNPSGKLPDAARLTVNTIQAATAQEWGAVLQQNDGRVAVHRMGVSEWRRRAEKNIVEQGRNGAISFEEYLKLHNEIMMGLHDEERP
jgi:hypothetical protein